MRRTYLTVALLFAPGLAFAEQVNLGVDTSVTRLRDGTDSLTLGGTGLTIVYAPTSELTFSLGQTLFKPVAKDGDVRLRRPTLTARFLPVPRSHGSGVVGVLFEASPPIVDGATVFDRLDPDVAVDGVLAVQFNDVLESRFHVGYGFQGGNPDLQCSTSLMADHMLLAKLAAVLSSGPWTVQSQLEARLYLVNQNDDLIGVYGSLHAALQVSGGWSVTTSAEFGMLSNPNSYTDPTSVTVGLGIVRHFGTVRALATEPTVTTPRRLVVPIAHCS